MKYFDVNPSVLQWSSEEVVIPYYDSMSKKVRRYFPDFLIKVKTANGESTTHLIEVKPSKDLRPPVGGRGKKKSTVLYEMKSYRMNRDKFASARKWCKERGIIFDVWTEKHLKQKG
ncbi:MAG: TnsA endonuclease N-terminal domain-containing protein [Anaerolineales bacterium]|nr:TnsA endonuclease N-terminal domain-containing protein [Anaerolineales bacterium]